MIAMVVRRMLRRHRSMGQFPQCECSAEILERQRRRWIVGCLKWGGLAFSLAVWLVLLAMVAHLIYLTLRESGG